MPRTEFPPFDPEGDGYDYATAQRRGFAPDEHGHLNSRDPETGMQLKGKAHPTYRKGIEVDRGLGLQEEKRDGRYYTVPRFARGGRVLNHVISRKPGC